MDSFDQTSQFRYNPSENRTEFSGILEIFVHHARNIHNICIYENQDVYAKFSLTYNPDETFSTRIINGGGKNPEFNEKLVIKINQFDAAVVKCEMWMLSRAKSFMEDQLLGFVLVPVSMILEKGELTQDFSLSSTDLFHSPAGTVRLSLSLVTSFPFKHTVRSTPDSSISSEVVLLDPTEIEFPDINVVKENQQMVYEYFGLSSQCSGGTGTRSGPIIGHNEHNGPGSFLCLGASGSGPSQSHHVDDYEMVANSGSISPNESIQNSGLFSSSMTSLSDDRNSADSLDKKGNLAGELSDSANVESPITKGKKPSEKNEGKEESEMQKRIVDMYMRSMQQFTESLAKMKLPINLEAEEARENGDVIQRVIKNDVEMEMATEKKKKKDGGRVFYGSRAFF